jgi:hypothetical protein
VRIRNQKQLFAELKKQSAMVEISKNLKISENIF